MSHPSETHPSWPRYRLLTDETTALEYEIIGLLSEALCRPEGDGQPNPGENLKIETLKTLLKPKLVELKELQKLFYGPEDDKPVLHRK